MTAEQIQKSLVMFRIVKADDDNTALHQAIETTTRANTVSSSKPPTAASRVYRTLKYTDCEDVEERSVQTNRKET